MNIKHFLTKHSLEAFVVLFLIVFAVLYFSNRTIAQQSGPFIAPADLNPTCPPDDNNCYVNPIAIGSTVANSGTEGSILFLGASGALSQDNANLFWDAAEEWLGIGTDSPSTRLTIGSEGAITTTEWELTDGAPIDIDWGDGNQQEVTLGDNRTINFSNNYVAGQTLRLIVCQDGTGSRTVTWGDPNIIWNDGNTAPTLTTTANSCDVLTFLATEATGPLKIFGSSVLDFAP